MVLTGLAVRGPARDYNVAMPIVASPPPVSGRFMENGVCLWNKRSFSWKIKNIKHELQQQELIQVQTGELTQEQYDKYNNRLMNRLAHMHYHYNF